MPSKVHIEILWQNDDAVAVSKPAGLATIPGRDEPESVLHTLAAQIGIPAGGTADPRLRVVHRLDKQTSGVLLFAKHAQAQRHLSHQFQNNTISKEYLALVSGRPSGDEGEIDEPLGRHPSASTKMAIAKHGGRPARTGWKVEEVFRQFTLLRVFPRTGKTHQIRVHLESIGLPLAIDALYNATPPGKPTGLFLSQFKQAYRPTRGEEERPLIDRLTLHAEKLIFLDLQGQTVEVKCPPPKDFRAILNQMRRWGQ
ncbi:MAG TPA: RluA family pseudouridine synthase [Tepidisphaeraceae bacterium]|jgi:23S rRNA pseudouridine955/2504/2580 synthase/23S rRNA pseudouridine1911/1915/1917 synthase|nr:RluA family pseudouridine synthase [Tepidisphaeraceae bacterium]